MKAGGPNVVFIFIDDMGYGDLSCTGNEDVETANIDRLAEEGVRLTQFYVSSPICSPSRVAVTTGQYPARHLINSYLNNRRKNRARGMRDFLDPAAPCIARTFQDAGYATAHFGKWHMGGGRDVDDAPLPQAYGFDESLVSFEGLGDRILPPGGLSDASEKLGRGKVRRVEKHQQTEIYVDRSIDFIKRHQGEPFYLHLWLNDVHDAHKPRPDMLAKYERFKANPYVQKFYAVLDEMDRQIGRLVDAIDRMGLAEETLIVLTSDNGPTAWPRYRREGFEPPGSTAGLRGRKWSLYEGGIRMPLIARWKGRIPEGRVDDETVMAAVDLFPTFCRLAGVESPEADFDGEDLSAALLGQPVDRTRPIFWEYGRDPSYLKPADESGQSPNLAIRDGKWKLLVNADGSRLELYDFSRDTSETKNVAAEYPEVATALSEKLLAWRWALPTLESPSPVRPDPDETTSEVQVDRPDPPPGRMLTRFAWDVRPDNVWKEYPRPQLRRKAWQTLNGLWEYAIEGEAGAWTKGRVVNADFDPLARLDRKEPEEWDGPILVPFCVESALSRVGRLVRPNQLLWYRRSFQVPEGWSGQRVRLNFEAVDWHTILWLNGKRVGEHKGGYDPFSLDITDALKPQGDQELVMVVWDPTNMGDQAIGKQALPELRRGFRYTPTTGIWQSVWMEPVDDTSIERLKIVTDIDAGRATVSASIRNPQPGMLLGVEAFDGKRSVAKATGPATEAVSLSIPNAKLWSPGSPFRYRLEAKLLVDDEAADEVSSYFGMRKIAIGKDDRGINRVFLNNEVLPFQFGPLDQGYWPDGILTPASDRAAAFDLEYLKRIGCSCVRVHIKVHPDRWYFHCDRLGLLVWQDMVCTRKFDQNITPESAAQWEHEQQRMIDHLHNHPSVVQWIVFNEGWGQYDTERLTEWTKEYDPTRLVTCASGWTDVPDCGDFFDAHDYTFYPTVPPHETEPNRAVVIGEFGGFNVGTPGRHWHFNQVVTPRSDLIREGGRESYANGEAWLRHYQRWLDGWRYLIADHGVCAGIYTQISDVEHELNGWLTYDRAVSKIPPEELRELHEKLYDLGARPGGVILPNSKDEPQQWRFAIGPEPPEGWTSPDFDDSSWRSITTPLGTVTEGPIRAATETKARNLYLRKTFDLEDVPSRLAVRAYCTGDVQVYLNGEPATIFRNQGPRGRLGVTIVPLADSVLDSLQPGRNTIAVRCSTKGEPRLIDVGLVELDGQ